MDFRLDLGRVDPGGGRLWRRGGFSVYEAVWVGVEGDLEGFLAFGTDLVGLSAVDLVWRHEADAEMVVVAIVPVEEPAAEGLGVLDGTEFIGELGLMFAVLKRLS